ncbi:sodium-dependent glucose transporter 1-like [Mizuhopecten yessoensis]|uniref:Sodium-dependent glucose transporter 1 n=1 Tax=Mizuhopecten yessoensis TaxID=6573 RepID=A0A210QP74_MIZYE|nr:sodium-dependent glucose transporter 1-like [Mizuhopecten yessoensis]OWF50543.1 Sodium-dependent glucose transporter 1 [Mizuhopecten yessoensis]
MMHDVEEEEVTFDEAGLLDNKQKRSRSSVWCQSMIKILCLSLAFFSLGLCIAIPGPTLIDLGERVQSDTTHMALVFTARSVGYLLGALVGGFLFDIFDKQLLLCVTLFLASLATCVIPWALTLVVLAVMFSLQGIAMGVLDTGGNALCVRIWGKRSSPYIQVMHFAFGIGAFIAPLLSQPFLHEVSLANTSSTNPITDGSQILRLLINNGSSLRIKREDLKSGQNLTKSLNDSSSFVTSLKTSTSPPVSMESNDSVTTLAPTTTTVKIRKPSANDLPLAPGCADGGCAKNKDDMTDSDKAAPPVPPMSSPDSKKSSITLTPTTVSQGSGNALNDSFNGTSVDNTNDKSTPIISTISTLPLSTPPNQATTTTSILKATTTTPKPTTTTPKPTTTTPKPTTTTPKPTTTTPKPTTTTPKSTTTTSKPTTTTPKPTTATPKPTTLPIDIADCLLCAGVNKSLLNIDDVQETSTAVNQSDVTDITTVTMETSTAVKPQTVGDMFNTMVQSVKNMSKIQFSYTIIAALLLVNAVIFLILFCYDKKKGDLDLIAQREKEDYVQNTCVRLVILLVMFLFFLSYIGMETTYGGLIMTFTVEYMDWNKNQGAIVTAIFWGSLAAGRGFSIFIAGCCKPHCMLIIDLFLVIGGATMLSFFVQKYSFILWLGTLFLGLGMSSIFPTGLAWTEQYFRMTGKSTAVLVTGSALGQMIIPVATGYTFEKINKMYLMYVVLILSVFCTVLFIVMQLLASKCSKMSVSQNGFMPLRSEDSIELDGMSYGTTEESTRRRLLPSYNDVEYDQLPQDGDFELD